jgi:cardiolipin synthase
VDFQADHLGKDIEPSVLETATNNQITLLHNGEEYFPLLEAALDQATQRIYLESYIFADDRTGKRIGEALGRAAARGVATHMLIDGYGSKDLPQTMRDYLEKTGVKALVFRANISPWTLQRQRLRRLHRKIAVVDLKIAFVGGINIIDDTGKDGQAIPRYDFAVSIKGPLVKEIHDSARRLWLRVAWYRRLRFDRDQYTKILAPPTNSQGCMRSAFLVRDNIRHRRDIEDAYLQAIGQANTEIILVNAYFLPGLAFRHALLAAAGRGIRVVLLLQGIMDKRLFQSASRALYGSFLDAGIEIYEYHQGPLHAKVAVIDERWATVGSSNLDPFSLLLALEANVIVDDRKFAAALKHSLTQAITMRARRVFESDWSAQPIMVRLMNWLSYGLVLLMIGIAGYAPQSRTKKPERP